MINPLAPFHFSVAENTFVEGLQVASFGSTTLWLEGPATLFQPQLPAEFSTSSPRGLRALPKSASPVLRQVPSELQNQVDHWFGDLPDRLSRLEDQIFQFSQCGPLYLWEAAEQRRHFLERFAPALAEAVVLCRLGRDLDAYTLLLKTSIALLPFSDEESQASLDFLLPALEGVPAAERTVWISRNFIGLMKALLRSLEVREEKLMARQPPERNLADIQTLQEESSNLKGLVAVVESSSGNSTPAFHRAFAKCPRAVVHHVRHLLALIPSGNEALSLDHKIFIQFSLITPGIQELNRNLPRSRKPVETFTNAIKNFREGNHKACLQGLDTLKRSAAKSHHDNLTSSIDELSRVIRRAYGV